MSQVVHSFMRECSPEWLAGDSQPSGVGRSGKNPQGCFDRS